MTLKNKKLGIVLNFIDFRNDIRDLILEISRTSEVVIFTNKKDLDNTNFFFKDKKNIIIREYQETKNFHNKFWLRLFSYFGKIPNSKKNYNLMNFFLILNNENKLQKYFNFFTYNISSFFPKIISYDFILDRLKSNNSNILNEIKKLLFISKINSDELLAIAIQNGIEVEAYIYSWDHPAKHKEFSKKIKYIVWNNWVKNDLEILHKIPRNNIKIVGSTQFSYIKEFLFNRPTKKKYNFEYLYFGCVAGIDRLVEEEVQTILSLARLILENSNLKLVVRPYPILKNWHLYDKLKKIENIYLDNDYKKEENMSIDKKKIFEKLQCIQNSKGFLHMGTTLGLEACFLNVPSIITNFGYKKSGIFINLNNVVNQSHNKQYMIQKFPNYINDKIQFVNFLKNLQSKKFLKLNQFVKNSFNLKYIREIARDII